MTLQTEKQRFLQRAGVTNAEQAIRKTLLASLRRNQAYADGYSNREPFREALRVELRVHGSLLLQGMTEVEHVKRLEDVANSLSQTYGGILYKGRLRIGTVQKALNLYLKYVWCLDSSCPMPLHCPLDRIILQAARINGNWTDLDSLATYGHWISRLQAHATSEGYSSLAEWELHKW